MSADHAIPYVKIWGVLLAALFISLIIGAITTHPAAIALIFAIAVAKAALVVTYFMHMKFEARWILLTMGGTALIPVIFWLGVAPDVVLVFGEMDEYPRVPVAMAADAASADAAPDPDKGKGIYEGYCKACHQADGTGQIAGSAMAADFTDGVRLQKTDAELLESISNGSTGDIGVMPGWAASLSEAQRRHVLAFIRQEFGP
ncbi:MAG: c-type cytochrome [Proteobacteria bacterium]|nr:c-type cytochrome [Pseudomonadota bacterium]MCP4916383.1 c-type cytochrome [Pseudomonadota bacterium]